MVLCVRECRPSPKSMGCFQAHQSRSFRDGRVGFCFVESRNEPVPHMTAVHKNDACEFQPEARRRVRRDGRHEGGCHVRVVAPGVSRGASLPRSLPPLPPLTPSLQAPPLFSVSISLQLELIDDHDLRLRKPGPTIMLSAAPCSSGLRRARMLPVERSVDRDVSSRWLIIGPD